jgi:nucleoside-triphosphatase THEP1
MKGPITLRGRNVLLLTGEPGSGKTLALQALLEDLSTAGILAGGILAPGTYTDCGQKDYGLELVPRNTVYRLSSRTAYPGWQAIGGFFFNPEAVSAGLRHLSSLARKKYSLYLLDEIGPFELDGRVWAPAIPGLLRRGLPMIWTVRPRILEQVKTRWVLPDALSLRVEAGEMNTLQRKIRAWTTKYIQG